MSSDSIVDKVRERYGKIATGELSGCAESACCATGSAEEATALQIGYTEDELKLVGDGANLGLGCGAPIGFLAPKPGETVLDLGSGAGLDAFIAAAQVGASGRVIGVDMTPEMLEKARENAARMGLGNVEFRSGRLEALPVEDASIDALTSNCVINLVPDKSAVFREIARVLKPGGRLVISDIILDGDLPQAVVKDVLAYVGCISGASRREDYFGMLERAGLSGIVLHKDIDYLETAKYTFSPALRAAVDAAGIRDEDLRGVVRSVTYGATKSLRSAG